MTKLNRHLGKYEILAELGRGGFATVYHARDTHMGREVALKVIQGSHVHDAVFVERFRQEALTAAQLHHPHLITVYDFGESEGQMFLAMRRVNGPSLATWLTERGRLPLPEALPLLQQVAQALDYIHAQNLVHRDLKPANLLLEGAAPHWLVTLADFGLVRSLESSAALTQTSSILGTAAYLAPEQADPKQWGEVTALTDIYAFGVLAFQLLVGQLPFEGETAALLHAHAYDEPVIPLELIPEFSDDLVAILLKALAKPPAERYPSAGALAVALQEVVARREQQQARQAQLAELLTQAQVARQAQAWPRVTELCSQIIQLDPAHPDAVKMMVEAASGIQQTSAAETQRRERQQRYDQAKQALAAENWSSAVEELQIVVDTDPDFKDAAELLAQARDEQSRAEAYNEAIALAETEQWAAACRAWLQVLPGRLDYQDGDAATRLLAAVAGLLDQVEQQQQDLDLGRSALSLHDRLATALYRQTWPEVIALAEDLLALAPGLAWSPDWLEEARGRSVIDASLPSRPAQPAGETITWEKDGKAMVRVPAGEFLYGDNKEKKTLPEFWIDKTPVTNAEYARFVAETHHRSPKHWIGDKPPGELANHPVVEVSWHDAQAYAKWAGKRLPSEEEWEKAARGTDGRKYPWGDESPTKGLCNFNENGGTTTPVGQYSPHGDSPYDCVDMSGNVWEWTASDGRYGRKVLRGGSWINDEANVRAANRYDNSYVKPDDRRFDSIGFRCAAPPGHNNE